jgi:ankyrin repeat protein
VSLKFFLRGSGQNRKVLKNKPILKGSNLETKDKNGKTLLIMVLFESHLNIVEYFISKGAFTTNLRNSY